MVDSLKNQLQHTFYEYRLIYPDEALKAGIEGDINLTFDVSPDCEIVNVRQDTVLGHGTEQAINESLELVKKEWSGQHKGKCEELKDVEVLVNFRLK